MSLKATIMTDMKAAMKSKDQAALRTLRALKSAIMNVETSAGRNDEPLSEDEEMKLLVKQAKQRRDSMQQYIDNGREDLASVEKEELEVIERYLPKALAPEEIEAQVKAIMAEVGASSMKDMGKVMGIASKKMAGQADGKDISAVVKRLLS
ncbi:GatB/YqeY domain-containing protein [Pontibacter sp. G13]|uniref:GatB/YqeY domain-containing protein n=1 Tax=Pontibacter sp. G13 TaxID=3074898 RepID=UPI00288989F7|nr:GatB/YqeY domain-containing protein [Pontibacter sp. G13]WNJ16498.1 GatB/YqeY domain-containing protein [Pontibacter sp. G13]